MSIATFFVNKCLKNLQENVTLLWAKLSDPSSLVTVNASGALVDAAKGGMGSLANFAGDYVQKNASVLVMEAAKAAGYDKQIANALNLAYNLIAMSLMMRNDLLLMFLKKVARNTIIEIDKKDDRLDILRTKLQALYNALTILAAGDPVWNAYVEQLREALRLLAQSKVDIQLVRNTLSATDYFLGPKFKEGTAKLASAKELIVPLKDNPYLEPTWSGILTNAGYPTDKQRVAAIMAIPVLSKEVAKAFQTYSVSTTAINALLDAFMVGYDELQSGMPKLIKSYVLSLFDSGLVRLGDLNRSMALKLNGSEDEMTGPLSGFEPQPLPISVLSYKWALDLNLIISAFKMVPESQLNALNLSAGAVALYKDIVDKLRAMDGKTAPNAVLIQEDAKEAVGTFESQMLAFLIEANAAIVSSKVRAEIMALGSSMFARIDLSQKADTEIRDLLQSFVDYPLPDNEILEQILAGITKMLGDLGLDNALDKLETGKFGEFLGLNGNTATTVGAALAILAALKKCFGNKRNDQYVEIENDLKADKDLLNISLSLNFDLAIFKNIEDCAKLNGYARVFNLQEMFCSLVKSNSNVSKAMEKFVDLVSF